MPPSQQLLFDPKALEKAPDATIAQLVQIDLGDLMSTLERHPVLFGLASAHYERAKVDEVLAGNEADRIKAETFLRLAQQDPTLAVNRLERFVETDAQYQAAVSRHLEAKRRAGPLKALVTSLEHRRDMLIQIASRQKQEMAHG